MSHGQIARMTYDRWKKRDEEKLGRPLTPSETKFLWELADDYAYEMKMDAENEGRHSHDEDEEESEDEA